MLLLAEGKLAGWKRGREGNLSDEWFAFRELLPVRACLCRGEGGWRGSKCIPLRLAAFCLQPDERGELGLMAGDDRGDGMLRGTFNEGARTGERPLDGAVVIDCCCCCLGAATLDPDVEMFAGAVLMQECVVFVCWDQLLKCWNQSRKESPKRQLLCTNRQWRLYKSGVRRAFQMKTRLPPAGSRRRGTMSLV